MKLHTHYWLVYIILQLYLCQLVQFWHHFDLLHLQKGDTHRRTQGFHQLTNYTIIGEYAIWNTIGELSLVTNTGNYIKMWYIPYMIFKPPTIKTISTKLLE